MLETVAHRSEAKVGEQTLQPRRALLEVRVVPEARKQARRHARLVRSATCRRKAGRPAFGLYLVHPAPAAAKAASTIWGGVEKSGSPTSRWMTSFRSAASAMISLMAERGIPAARRENGRTAASVACVEG